MVILGGVLGIEALAAQPGLNSTYLRLRRGKLLAELGGGEVLSV